MAAAIRHLGVSEVTSCRRRQRVPRDERRSVARLLKQLPKENERLRYAVFDLALDQQIPAQAAWGES